MSSALMTAWALIGLVAVQRLAETAYAARNTKRLLAQGGGEMGAGHYPLLILLHGSWLVTILAMLPAEPPIYVLPLVLFLVLQAARLWVLASLGPYWTTRIITVPGVPLVKKGPYRFLKHPNYVVVSGEIAMFPLVFGKIWVAVIFTLLNAAVLFWRIRVEDAALAPRR
jgi:methyltransferase